MRALVLWAQAHSANLGVRALASGTEAVLDRAFPGIDVAFQGYGDGDAPVRIGSTRAQARRLLSPRNELVDWLRGFDVVVDTRAGDSFTDSYGMARLWTMSLMAATLRRAGVAVVLGPQTIGPFSSTRGRLVARATLQASALVMVRDAASLVETERLGRRADLLTTDVVFAMPVPSVAVTRDVVVNPSGLLWHENRHVDAARYRAVIDDLCHRLQQDGRRVSLMSHVLSHTLVDTDVPAAEQLAADLGGVEVLVPTDLDDARAMLASATLVVGSRMHACLNALSVGRPAVALAYSRKFEPLMSGLGWPHTVDLRHHDDPVSAVLSAMADPGLEPSVAAVRGRADKLVAKAVEVMRHVG